MSQSFLRVKDRSKPGLKINDTVSTEIFGLFVRHALQRLFRLHDRNRMREPFQIFCETSLIRAAEEPLGKSIGIVCRKAFVPGISRQINDGLRSQHAIQMLVQEDFGKAYQ